MSGHVLCCYTVYKFRGLLSPNGILPGAKFTLFSNPVFPYINIVTARHSSSGLQPDIAALSRGRHLYSAVRPSRWASAHVLVFAVLERPIVKRFALSYRSVSCLSVLSLCDVGVLWPNGWMDRDKTWHGSRPRPHCVRWGPSSPEGDTARQFSAYVCCSQTAVQIKMPLGTKVGLDPVHIVLDGDPAILTQWGTGPNVWPMPVVGKQLDGSRCHLVGRQTSTQATMYLMGTQQHPHRKQHPPLPGVYCG